MAIKDLIGPGFVGTDTIKSIVTRGMGAASISAHLLVNTNHIVGDVATVDRFPRNRAVTGYPFSLMNRTDATPVTTGTVTAKITKDGGTQATIAATPVHEGNGQWSIDLSATEMDADVVGIIFTHASAVPVQRTLTTWGC